MFEDEVTLKIIGKNEEEKFSKPFKKLKRLSEDYFLNYMILFFNIDFSLNMTFNNNFVQFKEGVG